jgi:23S rRNA (cytosine1962-C5)-methyltransferase
MENNDKIVLELENLLRRAKEVRERLTIQSNAYRLVNGQSDGLAGLIIERFNNHFQIQISDAKWFVLIDKIKSNLLNTYPVQYIVLRHRIGENGPLPKAELKTIFEKDTCGAITVIQEGSHQFKIDMLNPIQPGIYLDSRVIRHKITKDSQGKKVLNAFSFTASYGVYAKGKGAIFTCNVDMSPKILEKAKENYRLNGLEMAESEFVRADVRDYLKVCATKKFLFDVIILDQMPNSAKTNRGNFNAKDEIPDLIHASMKILTSRAELFISTTSPDVTMKMLHQWVESTAYQHRYDIEKSVIYHRDVDFTTDSSIKETHFNALWVRLSKK